MIGLTIGQSRLRARQLVANPNQIARGVLERELAHAPWLIGRRAQAREALRGQAERLEFPVQPVRVGHAPVAARAVRARFEILACLEMDDQVSSSQDVVMVVVVSRLEAEGLVEGACSTDIGRGKDGLRPFSWHGSTLLVGMS